jgi:hypothetical protein
VIVRDVPFSEFTFMIVSALVLMLVWVVYPALSYYAQEKKSKVASVAAKCLLSAYLIAFVGGFAALVLLSSSPRPVAEGDYEKLGSYTATVARVYPQSQLVEVETDFGVSLPVPASMMPEGADVVGATVDVDVSKLEATEHLSLLPNRDRGAAGEGGPIFVYDADCASSGVLTCSQALGDDGEHWYAVTSVRTS